MKLLYTYRLYIVNVYNLTHMYIFYRDFLAAGTWDSDHLICLGWFYCSDTCGTTLGRWNCMGI